MLEMNDGVRLFLANLGMLKYYDIFNAKGFDLESDIPHITLSDLETSLMIESKEDRAVLFTQAQKFRPSAEYTLFEWLHRHCLDHYFISFIESELTSLDSVAALQLPNANLYDELEMVLPGHQKRFERAVASLRTEGNRDALPEIPVTQGWWGKPDCLPQAKFDFLCVTANLFASHEPNRKASIASGGDLVPQIDFSIHLDFMVDSGSDVSTVQEKILGKLNLDLIGPVYSCGIHGGSYTNLYKARLEVGGEQMDVEVMASNYDSLGSRIVRHFRHVIDGKRHIWLKGDYKDPLPAILPMPTLNNKTSLDVAIPSSQQSLPPGNIRPLPPLSSPSSESGPERMRNENTSAASKANTAPSLPRNNNQPCSQDVITFPESQNRNTLTQNSSSSSNVHDEKALHSNGITSSSSSASQNTPLNPHSQNTIETATKPKQTNSHTSNSSSDISPVNVSGSGREEKCEKPCGDNVNKNSSDLACDIDVFFKAEKDVELNEEKLNKSSDMEVNLNLKFEGHKRHGSVDSSHLLSPKKVLKTGKNITIPKHFKDTDDDIDSVNPFVLSQANNLENRRRWSCSTSISGVTRHSKVSQSIKTLYEDRNDTGADRAVESQGEEVVHVLSEADDEDESMIEARDKSPEHSGRETRNFLPAFGTSVMIQFDDLDDGE